MNKLLLTAALTSLLLAACKPAQAPVSEVPAATAATAAASPASGDAAAPVATAPAPVAPGDAAAAAPVADDDKAPAADDGKAVDAAIDAALGDHITYRKVIEALQAAVAAKDAAAVAALVHYPIGVNIEGKNTVIKDPASFVKQYDKFMTPDIAKAITGTRYADVFANYKGVMLGRGEAWINGICKDNACKQVDVKVVTIQSTADLSP